LHYYKRSGQPPEHNHSRFTDSRLTTDDSRFTTHDSRLIIAFAGANRHREYVLPRRQGTGEGMIIRTIGIVRQIEVEFHRAAARCLGDVEIAAGTIGLIGARCIAEREKKLPAKRPHLGNFKYEQSVADSVQFKIRVSVF